MARVIRRCVAALVALGLALPAQAAGGRFQTGVNYALRNFASNVFAPGLQGAATDTTHTYAECRVPHYNDGPQAMASAALIYSNWWTNATNEAVSTNNVTVQAFIEYPSGTFTGVTFGGNAKGTVAPGINGVSDVMPLSTAIPAGAQFWTRTLVQVPTAGNTIPGAYTAWYVGGACQSGTGTPPSLTGTITGTALGLTPSAVIGPFTGPNQVSAILLGDSFGAGATDYASFPTGAHGNIGGFGRGFGGVAPLILAAVTGTSGAGQTAAMARRLDLATKAGATHGISEWVGNDLPNVSTVAALNAIEQPIWSLMQTKIPRIYAMTALPRPASSSDNCATTASQVSATTGGEGFGSSSPRGLFNTSLRGGTQPTLQGYFEVGGTVEPTLNAGYWIAQHSGTHNTNFLTGHITQAPTVSGSFQVMQLSFDNAPVGSITPPVSLQGLTLTFTSGTQSGNTTIASTYGAGGSATLGWPNGTFTGGNSPAIGDTFTLASQAIYSTNSLTSDCTHPKWSGVLGAVGYGGIFYTVDSIAATAKKMVLGGY